MRLAFSSARGGANDRSLAENDPNRVPVGPVGLEKGAETHVRERFAWARWRLSVNFANIIWRDRPIALEYAWIEGPRADAPVLLFLHEGLGSRSMWRDFPDRVCQAVGFRGLIYSRPGYGRSTPRPASETWGVDYLHCQAREVLPAFLSAIGLDPTRTPLWLFGHSDGGSIALLYAASFPQSLTGAIVVAPHIMVEDLTIENIAKARTTYLETDLPKKLERYHDDPDSAFWGWNDAWLQPPFREWSIEGELASIRCPLLAIQGVDDEYGTLEQIRGIARRLPQTELLEMPGCGHSPHRDQPEALIAAIEAFIRKTSHPVREPDKD
jgi:pimeloyl-ACP methyl ester carboxylesterase